MVQYIPNLLTLLRLVATPIIIVTFLEEQYAVVFYIFIAASFTDGLDGYIARTYNVESELGKILDPVADKLMVLSVYYLLFDLKLIPTWLWALVLFRDFCIVGYSLAMHYLNEPIAIRPTLLSKFNTFVQFIFLSLMLCHLANILDLLQYAENMQWLIGMTTLLSGVHYFWLWVLRPQNDSKSNY